ncbi:hypothetical protein TB2_002528 [Malus domestica]
MKCTEKWQKSRGISIARRLDVSLISQWTRVAFEDPARVIAGDHNGTFLGGVSLHSHLSSPNAAEALAVLMGRKFAQAKSFNWTIKYKLKGKMQKVHKISKYTYMHYNRKWKIRPNNTVFIHRNQLLWTLMLLMCCA